MLQQLYSIQEIGILLLEISAFLFGLLVLWLLLLAWTEQCKKRQQDRQRKQWEERIEHEQERRKVEE